MTIDATFAAPLTEPMFRLLESSLSPYLDGDLDASDDLLEALLGILAAAERTPEFVGTLFQAIKTLTPTTDLIAPLHCAIGAAMEVESPAPASSGYHSSSSSRTAPTRTSSGSSREGSIGGRIKGIFRNNPGRTYRVGDLVKTLSAMGYDHSGGAVGAALNGMLARGEAALVGEKPKLYLAADDPAAPAQATDTDTPDQAAPAPAPEQAPAEAPAADTHATTDSEPDAPKTPARRATTGKTGK